jgi:hypothetical protein
MSANDDAERKKIERELRESADQLRVFRGRRPLGVSDAPPEGPTCSFCGLAKNQVKALVEAPYANICNGCIDLCQDIVSKGL